MDKYPLPWIDDIFASLEGRKFFSKLDLAHAYQQVPEDEASKNFTTINTIKGLYQYTRHPFGVSSAPAIFQRTMEGLLQGIPNISVYLDDILIAGKAEQDHLAILQKILYRLQNAGIRLKRCKYAFMPSSIDYLGHSISADGLQPTKEKVRAISEVPTPPKVTQLRSFLGVVNYYSKFLPNLSTMSAPLYRLLQEQTQWIWMLNRIKHFMKPRLT